MWSEMTCHATIRSCIGIYPFPLVFLFTAMTTIAWDHSFRRSIVGCHANRGRFPKRNTVPTSLYGLPKEHSDDCVPSLTDYSSIGACILPVFPLRKSVRLPTDELTLNLYEERYIALAEYVLYGKSNKCDDAISAMVSEECSTISSDVSRETPLQFGAWYCSNKSQIVRNSVATPLIEPGDIGVVCHVIQHFDSSLSKRNDNGQKKMTMVGIAAARFRVERVLFNGFDNVDICPFILVVASRVCDTITMSENALGLTSLERKLFEEAAKHSVSLDSMSNVRDASLTQLIATFPDSWSEEERALIMEQQRHELSSFAMASALLSVDKTASEMEELLQMTSTLQRLKRIDEFLQEKNGCVRLIPHHVREELRKLPFRAVE